MIKAINKIILYILSLIGVSSIFTVVFFIYLFFNSRTDDYNLYMIKDHHYSEFNFYINKQKLLNKELKKCKNTDGKLVFFHYMKDLNIYIYNQDEEVFLCHT